MGTRVSYRSVNANLYKEMDVAGNPVRRLAEVSANAMMGHLNIGGTVVLNGTSMVLTDTRIGVQSLLLFMPETAAGAAIVAGLYVTNRGKNVATLNYPAANNESVDYVVIG